MKIDPFHFLGHGIGDISSFKIFIHFKSTCNSVSQRKIESLLNHHAKFFKLRPIWSESGVQLLPAVSNIKVWLKQIESYRVAYHLNEKINSTAIYKWDSRISYGNPDLVNSFNFNINELKPILQCRLLLNFGVECLVRDIQEVLPIHLCFYFQGKMLFESSWCQWSKTMLPVFFKQMAKRELTFPISNHMLHHFLGDFFTVYLTQQQFNAIDQQIRDELFELFLEACKMQPDRYDIRWLMKLNGGDEVNILSRLSRQEIRAIIKDYLALNKIIKSPYRATAYEPGERGINWLKQAFQNDFNELINL
jgi:hypothetical protein